MKIWVICQYYKPEPGAPAARLSGFARIWKEDGHKISILTALPNHPHGKIYNEYRNNPSRAEETVNGIRVLRHKMFVTPNEGIILKAFSQLSFAFSVFFKRFFTAPIEKPDIIMISSPSFFVAMSAWLIAWRYKIPFIMEVRDLWPGIFVELGVLKKGILLTILEKFELFLYNRAAAVVTVSRGFAQNIVERGVDGQKVFVITNGVSDSEIKEAQIPAQDGSVDRLRTELKIDPMTKIILYIGNHGTSQALGQVIDAARTLMARSDFVFLMVGEGADKPRLQRIAKGMPNIRFIGNQPKEKVWQFYNMSYLCIIPLKNIAGFSTFIPSKMFEIMASGRPFIGCVQGEAETIMNNSGGGIVVPPENPEKLAKAVLNLVDNPGKASNMGASGRKFVTQNYRHSLLARQYVGIFNKVIAEK